MMKRITAVACLMLFVLGFSSSASAVTFYPIANIEASTQADDLWPAFNLIQGPGIGFDTNEPHDKTLGGADGNWVTAACGFPCDYIETTGMPVLTIDLGEDRDLSEINVWGYASTNANGVSEFDLRFATDADGPGGFGTSITFNPTYVGLLNDDTTRQTFVFAQAVTARFVEFTALDNFFVAPGDGSGGEIPGGDRVGLGEIAFPIPEPTTALLMLVGILMLTLHRLPTFVRA
jgi:hypothetical protein